MSRLSRPQPHTTDRRAPRVGEHAIVIGASMAGLLAARVLSDSYDHVTVLDRDTLPDGLADHRRAVPQGRHAHGFQLGGQEALERLLPGFRDEAYAGGAPSVNLAGEARFRIGGSLLMRVRAGSDSIVASRPFIEGSVRRRVRAIDNVMLRDRCAVVDLLSDGGRVIGVRALDGGPGSDEEILHADLVVATTGRGGRVPAWLESIGYERPAEERVDIDMRYASRHVRMRPGALAGDKLVLDAAVPDRARGIAMVNEEGDRWVVTVYGYGAAEQPPTDHVGFLAFVATVADAEVAAAVAQAERLDEIATFATRASVLRRYDRLRRFPDGLLVMGDAICAFNPVYGQGMTVAAIEAEVLQRCLRDGDRRLPRRFFRGTRATVQQAWKLSTGGDLALPEVPQRAALPDRIVNRYILRLLAAAQRDAALSRVFLEVTGMIAPVTKLLSPKMMLRVLRGSLRAQGVVEAQSPHLVNAPHAPIAATPASSSSETSSAALYEAA